VVLLLESVERPAENDAALLKVFAPANVWLPVVTIPLTELEADGSTCQVPFPLASVVMTYPEIELLPTLKPVVMTMLSVKIFVHLEPVVPSA
jgi:hypothetical protein